MKKIRITYRYNSNLFNIGFIAESIKAAKEKFFADYSRNCKVISAKPYATT